MSLTASVTRLAERAPIPDILTRMAIDMFVERTRRGLDRRPETDERAFAWRMDDYPIAVNTEEANAQHYELPPEFFRLILGPRLKYSCALYDGPSVTLAAAEDVALEETCAHADIRDGQKILELGCGWGSLSLWMAQRYPGSKITIISNSSLQRTHIEARAKVLGLKNLKIITADMNDFLPEGTFDRIVSVEMFEHMSNWRRLLSRIATWLAPGGRFFMHIFAHRDRPYRFEVADRADWIAQHFFSGGIMPSHGLIRQFSDILEVEDEWRWSGEHYRRTANHGLENLDRNHGEVARIMRSVYGADARVWTRRWRLFFLATAGLFGAHGGDVWGVSHYRLKHPGGI